MDPLKSLCIHRWNSPTIDLEDGAVRVCCRVPRRETTDAELKEFGPDAILNSPYLLERRAEMFEGKQHADCNGCWLAERQGLPSPRGGEKSIQYHYEKIFNEKLDEAKKIDLAHPILRADSPGFIEIQLGIVCDLKCVYCWRGNSSSWLNEDYRFGEISKAEYEKLVRRTRPEFEKTFWQWFRTVARTTSMISLVGGEPMISPKFVPTLEKLGEILDEEGSKATLRMVSNLNCSSERMDQFLMILGKQIQKFDFWIDVSIEAFERKAEFIRSGLSWERFQSNFEKLASYAEKNNHVKISISATANALNVTSFGDFVQWLETIRKKYPQRIGFLRNSVIEPAWLAPKVLSKDFAIKYRALAERLRELHLVNPSLPTHDGWSYNLEAYAAYVEELGQTVQSFIPEREYLQAEFYRNIRKLEMKRKVSFVETFPEYAEFFALCESKTNEQPATL